MALHTISNPQELGNPAQLAKIVRELQGLRQSLVAGAAAGTKINVPAMRPEDTIVSAIVFTNAAAAAPVDDTPNITAQSAGATGTVTVSGNPADGDTVTVNGTVYTWKNTPNSKTSIKITAGNVNAMAAALASVINAYESRYESQLHGSPNRTPAVKATANAGVVTVAALAEGTAGNSISLARSGSNVAVSGANLAGGTATGGFKSTTDLTGKTVLVTWYDKNP